MSPDEITPAAGPEIVFCADEPGPEGSFEWSRLIVPAPSDRHRLVPDTTRGPLPGRSRETLT
jgi:hypothetical protein